MSHCVARVVYDPKFHFLVYELKIHILHYALVASSLTLVSDVLPQKSVFYQTASKGLNIFATLLILDLEFWAAII